jgi:hypothetical protein
MGKKIVLTGTTLTDLDAPKLATVDLIEHEDGSIFLLDWTHPLATASIASAPTDGLAAENLVATFANAIVGGTASAAFTRGAGYNGTKGVLERSTKGGVHGFVSPTAADNTVFQRLYVGTAIQQYIIDHPTDVFFLSVWGRITKATTAVTSSTPGIRAVIMSATSPSSNNLMLLSNTNGSRVATAVGPSISNGADGTWSGTIPASASNVRAALVTMPPEPAWNFSNDMIRAQGGFIHYRSYMENLTASGRSYATVDAIDYALFQKEVVNVGGRYYGDTFTDPTTLA